MGEALSVGIGISSEDVIDEINILQATKKAMTEAIKNTKGLSYVRKVNNGT